MPIYGKEAVPITRDVNVIGRFDFEQGDFQGGGDSGQQDERANGWQNVTLTAIQRLLRGCTISAPAEAKLLTNSLKSFMPSSWSMEEEIPATKKDATFPG